MHFSSIQKVDIFLISPQEYLFMLWAYAAYVAIENKVDNYMTQQLVISHILLFCLRFRVSIAVF